MRFYLVQFHLELEVVGEAGAHDPDFTQGSFWELEVSPLTTGLQYRQLGCALILQLLTACLCNIWEGESHCPVCDLVYEHINYNGGGWIGVAE